MSAPSGSRAVGAAIVVALVAGVVGYLVPTLDEPLLEVHPFRQTQTAWTAREFHQEGIDLLHPKLPVLGEPWEVPFEFPLFQALAVVPMKLGVSEHAALRGTSLVCFVLTALLLYGLVSHVAGPVSGVAAAGFFAVMPLSVLWSRTSMIEYLATAGGVGFAWFLVLWREHRLYRYLPLALVAGSVGMLVKPTTAVFWILPPLLYRPRAIPEQRSRRRVDLWTATSIVLPLAAAVLWTRHADAIKASGPVTEWLTGWNLRRWNFGWTRQRLDPDMWSPIVEVLSRYVLGLTSVLLVPAALAVSRSSQRSFWLGVAGAAVLPPLVFMNLYVYHDYYLIALSPALAALVGLGAGWVWTALRHRWLLTLLPLAGVLLALGTLALSRDYWARIHGGVGDPTALGLAAEIRRGTAAGEPVAIVGLDWSPTVLYYARRRGHMVTERTRDAAFEAIRRDGYKHLVLSDPAHDDLGFMAAWEWVGSRAPHLYGIADSAAELPYSPLVATNTEPARVSTPLLTGAPAGIRCGVMTRVPIGPRGAWIRLLAPEPNTRVFLGRLAPVPARRSIYVAPELSRDGYASVTCSGAASLRVGSVVDAPPPQ